MQLRFKGRSRISLLLTVVLVTITICCDVNSKNKKPGEQIVLDTINKNSLQQNITPVFGYRFTIEGDFDGDGEKEKLTEHFISGIDKRETNKYYDGFEDYDDMFVKVMKKEPISFVICDRKQIDTMRIYSGQIFGVAYLKNEGDLNGDGTDEVSYVVDWADWSNLNSWNIVTYKRHKWVRLYSFPIWDWQLPDLPHATNQYGLFGAEGRTIVSDTANDMLIKKLIEFEGLVKKINTNKIQVIYRNDEADIDTMFVDLKHLRRKKKFSNG